MKAIQLLIQAILVFTVPACKKPTSMNDTTVTPAPDTTLNNSFFAKGADISWLTQMESAGIKFYNAAGNETGCIQLLQSLGMNAVRLRVWVNPADGWCNTSDLLTKAIRAKQ